MKTNQCLSHLKKLQFLGFLIDTEKMIVTLTQEKKDRLGEECHKLISKKQATIREVARVLTRFNSFKFFWC